MIKDDIEHLNYVYNKLANDIGANINNDYMVKFRTIIDSEMEQFKNDSKPNIGDFISIKSNDGDGYFITKITNIVWDELNLMYKYYFIIDNEELYVFEDDANIDDRIKTLK